jgi:hypothetical protein
MNAQRMVIAETCLNAPYDKSMAFPEIVGTLIKAGFEGYVVDYRCSTTTYFLPDGDSVALENRPSEGSVAPQHVEHFPQEPMAHSSCTARWPARTGARRCRRARSCLRTPSTAHSTDSMRVRCPRVLASGRSHVTTVASSASASATYMAS